jgi:hypothetical protein
MSTAKIIVVVLPLCCSRLCGGITSLQRGHDLVETDLAPVGS